jgi:AcrR family transcriptional regulator
MSTVREARRAQIVAAARALVAEGGLSALTIGALEKRLAFTRGVITYHFVDKEDIIGAVLESAVADIDGGTLAEARHSASFAEKVHAVLHTKVRGFLDNAEARACLVSFWSRIGVDPRAREVNHRLFASWRTQATALVKAGIKAGDVRRDADCDAIAALLVGLVVGIVVQVAFEESQDTDRLVREAAAMVLARCAHSPA